MANKSFYQDHYFKNPGVHVVCGNMVLAGASNPTSQVGAGYTATVSGNTIIVTLTDSYLQLLAGFAYLQEATGGNDKAMIISHAVTTGTGGTVTIETQSSDGTAAQLTGPLLHFVLYLRRTNSTA